MAHPENNPKCHTGKLKGMLNNFIKHYREDTL
jgi:hypothetical protein